MYQSFMQTKLKCGAEKIQTQVSSTDLNGCVACKKKKKEEYGKLLIYTNA